MHVRATLRDHGLGGVTPHPRDDAGQAGEGVLKICEPLGDFRAQGGNFGGKKREMLEWPAQEKLLVRLVRPDQPPQRPHEVPAVRPDAPVDQRVQLVRVGVAVGSACRIWVPALPRTSLKRLR